MAYLAIALAVMVAVGAAGYKGYSLGEDHVRAENAIAVEASRAAAEKERAATELSARTQAASLQNALGRQRRLSVDLGTALEAHIRALPAPRPDCPAIALTGELLDDWNRSNHAPAPGAAGRGVPGAGGTAADAAGAVPSGGDPQPPRSR